MRSRPSRMTTAAQDHHDCGDARERRGVAEAFGEERLADGGSGSHQDADLIRKS